ncbi:hypothetical protein CBS101457_006670 [Exobasidium rhododendri]|nr:hypothetical protein CBS101457_006670 [Exobasidium rhododendri]
MADNDRTSLNGHGVFAVIVFAVVALICIQPIYIPVPHTVARAATRLKHRLVGEHESAKARGEDDVDEAATSAGVATRRHVVLNHVWTPAIGILFLLATKTIGGEQIKVGIVGEEGVEPYDVLSLFISLAYIAISLDATGLLRYLAFQVCLKAGTNGFGLYFILFAFFWILGVLVGNDPVILSGTAFLIHLTRVAGISPPSAWIWAQFVAANISSAVLVSSNPTNLVIATGFNITFPVYTAYMVLPSLVSALVSLGMLLVFFRNRTNTSRAAKSKRDRRIRLDHIRGWAKSFHLPRSGLHSRTQRHSVSRPSTDNVIVMSTMSTDRVTPAQEKEENEEAEEEERRAPLIYIPPTIIRPDVDARAALVDIKGAIFNSCVMAATLIALIVTSIFGGVKVYEIAAPGAGVCLIRDVIYDWYTWRAVRKDATSANDAERPSSCQQGQETVDTARNESHQTKPLLSSITHALDHLAKVFPTVTYVLARLPLPLLPFAFGMFILVQSLSFVGFINIMAGGIGQVCSNGPATCAFFISVLAVFLCNLGGTNIGATILLTKALQSSYFQSHLDPSNADLVTKVGYFSIAFGSNVGALGGTFSASLAGLLWRDALRQRGVIVTKKQFLLWCSVVILPATFSGIGILLLEVQHFYNV